MINVEQRRARLRRKKAIRAGIIDAVCGLIVLVGIVCFVNGALNAWDAEIEAHGEYNGEYIQQIEMNTSYR